MNIKYVSKCDKFKLDYQRHASLWSHIIKDEANKNQVSETPIFFFLVYVVEAVDATVETLVDIPPYTMRH